MHKISPCKGCSERVPGCHDRCTSYQQWKMEHTAARIDTNIKRKYEVTQHSILGDYHMPKINKRK